MVNVDMLNICSGNAGHGGSANSGNAVGGIGGYRTGSGSGGSAYTGNPDSIQMLGHDHGLGDETSSLVRVLALMRLSGTGGTANGGNVYSSKQGGLVNLDMLNIDSGNAGNGGQANSGSATGGSGGCSS